ncbi:MAG: hypothetical protein ACLS43_12775 [Evtepia gabavorous]
MRCRTTSLLAIGKEANAPGRQAHRLQIDIKAASAAHEWEEEDAEASGLPKKRQAAGLEENSVPGGNSGDSSPDPQPDPSRPTARADRPYNL